MFPYFMLVLRENLMTHLHPNVEWMAARGMAARGIAHLDLFTLVGFPAS